MKRGIYFLLVMVATPVILVAQTVVSGIVKNTEGPLSGVTISEKGGSNAAQSDQDGRFRILLSKGRSVLVFSSVGYITQERSVTGEKELEVILQSNVQDINEVVVVGYGTTKKLTSTGAISSIKGADIRHIPTANVQNTLAGRLPGFVSVQRSGQPGRDASDFYIRGVSSLNPDGNQPLIIVDDIEYTYEQLSQINVNEIESISILKDASTTAVFGIKGANGVLVVKTRRGESGKPKINVRLETGAQSPVTRLKFLNAYESALLWNEAIANTEGDNTNQPFSPEALEHFRLGDAPYAYPDVNWYERIFKPVSFQRNSNVDVTGGSESIKYFISGGAFSQDGNLYNFEDHGDQVNNNYYYRRFNLRSNLDVQATQSLQLRLDFRANFNRINAPRAGNIVGEVFNFNKIRPWSAPFLNPDGSYAYANDTQDLLPTINARLATAGYRLDRRNDLNILFGGTQDLAAITKGLSFSARVAYASVESNGREQARDNLPVYQYFPETDSYQLKGGAPYVLSPYTLRAYQGDYNSRVNVQANFNYVRSFGEHQINTLLLYNRESYNTKGDKQSNWIPQNFQGFTFRTGYNYNEKYLVDITAAYNGSDRFQADKRYGLFPAISVGYNVAKESFIRNRFDFIDLLKLRASYGVVGSDKVAGDRYLYQQVYNTGGSYSFGETHQSVGTIYEGNLGNSNVTWEKQNSFDVGLDLSILKNRFSLMVDYFHNIRYDQLVTSQSLPLNIGVGVSPTNIARVRNRGVEFELNYNDHIGAFNYNVKGVLTYFKNKVLFQDEPTPAFPWLRLTGHQVNQPMGYLFDGFYTEENIAESAKPAGGYEVRPGDLRYKDLNDDGVIDDFDRTAIGRPDIPNTSFGLTLGGSYKGFSFNVLLQGTTGYSFSVQGSGIEPFQSQFQPIHQQRWTPETASTARFPRLTTNPTTINSPSSYLSDFWLIDATYLRLKTVELGYQLPDRWLPFKMNNARVYLSGYNLLTWTNYSLYQQDPEVTSNTAGDAYQNQRVINLGIQIGL
ncbi:TonB-linked outer membrane protein, SusC/RagA family [Parapedobacter composti]|uniref:TonB-linked outer membrane protein, SusC/RagA family n=1 Tax=Parapedobacter composti TaxID=623281 RepID=A0A1I1KWM4_9SPHI|nr:TonB-dependent receptor [Parapedobacter composti]SFC65131.1 TonB-linked outer membrane protein, SusC/RagA family [Parapedobacter composti]